jgi:hypothetical protein
MRAVTSGRYNMLLDELFKAVGKAACEQGWETAVEDDLPDLKQLACHREDGLLHAVTRLDLLLMIPGNDPATAPGITLFFIFLVDPDKVEDMRAMGKLLRQNDFLALRQQCEVLLHHVGITGGVPDVSIVTRPRSIRTKFCGDRITVPAFLVEIAYWLPVKITER